VLKLTLSVVNENESLLGSSWQGNGETKEAGNAGDLVYSSFAPLSVSARALPVQAVPTFSTPATALGTWSRAELNDVSKGRHPAQYALGLQCNGTYRRGSRYQMNALYTINSRFDVWRSARNRHQAVRVLHRLSGCGLR
jgi:hypothetical protein